jgi:hypothetical protein
MDDVNYKDYRIIALPWRMEDGKWKPDIQIMHSSNGDGFRINLPTFGRKYETEKEAEQAGLTFAKKWIDNGLPPLIDEADYVD